MTDSCAKCGRELASIHVRPRYDLLCEVCSTRSANERLGRALELRSHALTAARLVNSESQQVVKRWERRAKRWKAIAKKMKEANDGT